MAAVKRSDGSWHVDFYFGGSRIRRKSPINTKRGAEHYEKHLVNQLLAGKDPFQKNETEKVMLFKDFVPLWLKTYVKPNNKDSEYKSKESILRRHLLPFFGKMRLSEIGSLEIEQFKAKQMDERLSPKTINNHLGVLRKSLVCARDWKKLETVPKFQPLKTQKPKIEWLTPKEQNLLVDAETDPLWHMMIQMGLQTGMRIGELMALHWEDVDLRTGMITIRYNLQDSGKISSTKSNKIREVPIESALVLELVQFKEYSRTKRLFEKAPDGLRINRQKATRALKAICEDVGMRPVSWHILRHTFATNLCSRGASIRTVQELLGHSDIRMTERYSHVGAQEKRAAIRLLSGDLTTFGQYMVNEQKPEPEFIHVRPLPKQQ